MAQISNKQYCRVYKVEYSFDDVELNKHITLVELCPTFHSVIEYMHKIEDDCKILDNPFYSCRSNIHFRIVPDLISEKKYVSLFKND